jgi:hypothetical protein
VVGNRISSVEYGVPHAFIEDLHANHSPNTVIRGLSQQHLFTIKN